MYVGLFVAYLGEAGILHQVVPVIPLERLEARLMPASDPPVMVLVIRSIATGEVIERISMPCANDRNYRRRRTRPWPQKAHEGNQQTTSPA